MFTLFRKSDLKIIHETILANCRTIVRHLSVDIGERTIRKYENLEASRTYIKSIFNSFGFQTREELYSVDTREVANIEVEITGTTHPEKIIIVGAHYDTIEDSPGADDNATAVAALLELCRLLKNKRYKNTVRFVAFTLEEPPFFSTDQMGSMHYAASCRARNETISLMVCLEMLGCAGKHMHQDFPPVCTGNKFPRSGDFLAVTSLPSYSQYVFLWKKIYTETVGKHIYDMVAPASIPGIDFSDHRSFIKNKYPAIMISDTGFYRNKNYHTPDDCFETVNFTFLEDAVYNMYLTMEILPDMDAIC